MRTALIFPGQGNQEVGMGYNLIQKHPQLQSFFIKADDILGFELTNYIWTDCPEFKQTNVIQAGLFTIACAMLELVDFQYDMVAGHSLGEYAAMYAAKIITFEEGLQLIKVRGEAMDKVCKKTNSGMIACLGKGDIKGLSKASNCEVANYNSSTQTVLSGLSKNIEQAEQLASEFGFTRAMRLNAAGAYHSTLMKTASDQFAEFLSDFEINPKTTKIELITNLSGTPLKLNQIKQNMIKQIYSTVHWIQSIEYMKSVGIEKFIEVGYGTTLTKLLTRDGFDCIKLSAI